MGLFACWQRRELGRAVDLDAARESFEAIGFRVTRGGSGERLRLIRGTPLIGLKYDSEGNEVQVELAPDGQGGTCLWVGTTGPPGEVHLMRRRFARLAERFAGDLVRQDRVQPLADEAAWIAREMQVAAQRGVRALALGAQALSPPGGSLRR